MTNLLFGLLRVVSPPPPDLILEAVFTVAVQQLMAQQAVRRADCPQAA